MKSKRFTLTEVLVVVCIIGFMTYALMPLVSHIFTGNAVDYGARMFKSYCDMARVYAAQSQKNVSVIIVANLNDSTKKPMDTLETPEIFSRCAYRAGIINPSDKSGEWAVEWVKNSKWNFLPVGSFFYSASACSDGTIWDPSLIKKDVILDKERLVIYPTQYAAYCITYLPNGAAEMSDRIWIAQGHPNVEMENKWKMSADDYSDLSEGDSNMVMVDIQRLTGHSTIINHGEKGWVKSADSPVNY